MLDYCGIIRKENHTIKTNRTISLESPQKQFLPFQFKQRSVYWKPFHMKNYSISFYTPSCIFSASKRKGPVNQQRYFIWEKVAHVLMMTFTYCLTLIFILWKTGWGSEGISVWVRGWCWNKCSTQPTCRGTIHTYISSFSETIIPHIILTRGGVGLRGYDVLNSV